MNMCLVSNSPTKVWFLLFLGWLGVAGKELEGNGCIVRNGEKYQQQSKDCHTESQGIHYNCLFLFRSMKFKPGCDSFINGIPCFWSWLLGWQQNNDNWRAKCNKGNYSCKNIAFTIIVGNMWFGYTGHSRIFYLCRKPFWYDSNSSISASNVTLHGQLAGCHFFDTLNNSRLLYNLTWHCAYCL